MKLLTKAFEPGSNIDDTAAGAIHDHCRPADARSMPLVTTVIVDLDHTVWNWTAGWAAAMRALLSTLRQYGIDQDEAVSSFRRSYAAHGTMDASAALVEFADARPSRMTHAMLRRSARRYRNAWSPARIAYRGVAKGLRHLKRAGCTVIAYTESPSHTAVERLRLLGLTAAFDAVLSTRQTPDAVGAYTLGAVPALTDARSIACPWWPKGSAGSIAQLVAALGVDPEGVCTIGDHLEKDVAPAVASGTIAVWARYGTVRRPADQALVDRMCHWHHSAAERAVPPRPAVPPIVVDRFDAACTHLRPRRAQRARRPAW